MNEELNKLKNRIEDLKKDIPKLIGEEKYKYIMEIFSAGVKDINQEEVSEKIEKEWDALKNSAEKIFL